MLVTCFRFLCSRPSSSSFCTLFASPPWARRFRKSLPPSVECCAPEGCYEVGHLPRRPQRTLLRLRVEKVCSSCHAVPVLVSRCVCVLVCVSVCVCVCLACVVIHFRFVSSFLFLPRRLNSAVLDFAQPLSPVASYFSAEFFHLPIVYVFLHVPVSSSFFALSLSRLRSVFSVCDH